MKRRLLITVAAATVLAFAGGIASATIPDSQGAISAALPGSEQACKAGVTTIKGFQARVFCGPASVKGTVNGKPFAISGGVCDGHPSYFVVNIGTVVLGIGKSKPKLPYFGLLMGKSPAATASDPVVAKDGVYRKGLITITTPKVEADLHNETDLKITLTHGRRAGTFSGTKPGSTLFDTPTVKVSGSFHC